MSGDIKKGPFYAPELLRRVDGMSQTGGKKVLKAWSRASTIFSSFVGHAFAVYDGRKRVSVYVTEDMISHKSSELTLTCTSRGHTDSEIGEQGEGEKHGSEDISEICLYLSP